MGVLDKFKDLIGIEEIDDEMLEEELEPQAPVERRKAEPVRDSLCGHGSTGRAESMGNFSSAVSFFLSSGA